ncbi:MAG TPA: cobaltochelatase subunit CobN, partial [Propionibacteriaceae bacterium]|nr:cobaltochelatase subunit CobN [Propionibacteriaceae bacterium]
MPRIALVSTSDTDLLSARASGADYVYVNPSRAVHTEMAEVFAAADLIVARILGSPKSLCSGFARIRVEGRPMVVLGGEQTPDAALMEQSTVPIGVAADAHVYLAQGGPENLRQLHAFLSDTVLLTGKGFEPPVEQPAWGLLRPDPAPLRPEPAALRTEAAALRPEPVALRPEAVEGPFDELGTGSSAGSDRIRPRVGILFYRAQYTAGNTAYVAALADAVDAAGGVGVPIYATSLRDAPTDLLDYLGTLDALVTTVLAAGGTRPATATAGEDDEGWDVRALAALDIPILQALCLTWDRASWAASNEGMTPLDVATQVAVPEFDGRIITVPFSFKETDADGLPSYVPDSERCRRVAEIAVNHGRLRHIPHDQRKIAIMLSAYPTKHSRIGNAVGLDTPVSLIRLLRAMREAGYDLGAPGEIPGTGDLEPVEGESPDTTAGNALIHAIIAAGGQDPEWLTSEQLSGQPVRIPAATYRRWLAELPRELGEAVTEAWGEAPGELFVDRTHDPEGEIVAATLQAGNVVILVQPPRGFGENPIAIYHDPDLAPSHHYLAVYRWIEREFGAHAMIHVGKHGNL